MTGERSASAHPKVVVLGGGTGISACLRGLRSRTGQTTAIVTVADDGGSSGRLRKDYEVLPPGDIRNCLVAMADPEGLIGRLFDFRFEDSILKGHSLGNLLLVVLTRLTGSFREAIETARDMLGVEGRVIPSTETRVVLVAVHPDGTKSTGESCISRCGRPIVSMELRPSPPPASEAVRWELESADLIVVGPGSLYTSLVPNLLVPGIRETIAAVRAPVVIVGNLMTQPGETDGFTLSDHVRVLREVGGLPRLDAIVADDGPVAEAARARYEAAGARLVRPEPGQTSVDGVPLHTAPLAALIDGEYLRHDGERLGALLHTLATEAEKSSLD